MVMSDVGCPMSDVVYKLLTNSYFWPSITLFEVKTNFDNKGCGNVISEIQLYVKWGS